MTVAPLFKEFASAEEFEEAVKSAYGHPSCTLRYGQLYFNMLTKHRPDIAKALQGGALDPFYKEGVSDATRSVVESRW
jgi:hypothetical protein